MPIRVTPANSWWFYLACRKNTSGQIALADKNFVSSAKFPEKFWFNKFLLQIFC